MGTKGISSLCPSLIALDLGRALQTCRRWRFSQIMCLCEFYSVIVMHRGVCSSMLGTTNDEDGSKFGGPIGETSEVNVAGSMGCVCRLIWRVSSDILAGVVTCLARPALLLPGSWTRWRMALRPPGSHQGDISQAAPRGPDTKSVSLSFGHSRNVSIADPFRTVACVSLHTHLYRSLP